MFIGLANRPLPYAWGSTNAMAGFLGRPPGGGPEAELWLGTHPGSPTTVTTVVPSRPAMPPTLAEWIQAEPRLALVLPGEQARLPFLLKVLAAAKPLSLQVHPTPEQARRGFEDEQRRGISLEDPRRSYKDPYAKPEIIVAVSERFEALCGFRPAGEVVELVRALGPLAGVRGPLSAAATLLDRLAPAGAVADAVSWLLSSDPRVPECIGQLTAHAAEPGGMVGHLAETFATVRELAAQYPLDPGVGVAMLMNRVTLGAGEALYVPAGLMHAYLRGLGIELMAASDNVVRGGLTAKHVDSRELVRLLSFEQAPAKLLRPRRLGPTVRVYEPPAPFALAALEPSSSSQPFELLGPSIVLAEAGDVVLDDVDSNDSIEVRRGGAVFVSGDVSRIAVRGKGRLWIASSRRSPADGLAAGTVTRRRDAT